MKKLAFLISILSLISSNLTSQTSKTIKLKSGDLVKETLILHHHSLQNSDPLFEENFSIPARGVNVLFYRFRNSSGIRDNIDSIISVLNITKELRKTNRFKHLTLMLYIIEENTADRDDAIFVQRDSLVKIYGHYRVSTIQKFDYKHKSIVFQEKLLLLDKNGKVISNSCIANFDYSIHNK